MLGRKNIAGGKINLGGGAQFWAYISPQNNTENYVTKWRVRLEHTTSNWAGEITSEYPEKFLQTPELSGIFNVRVSASGPNFKEKNLDCVNWSPADIGCSSNCSAMVGIVASEDGNDAQYWTTWNAICS